jgi:hypothetical protein
VKVEVAGLFAEPKSDAQKLAEVEDGYGFEPRMLLPYLLLPSIEIEVTERTSGGYRVGASPRGRINNSPDGDGA